MSEVVGERAKSLMAEFERELKVARALREADAAWMEYVTCERVTPEIWQRYHDKWVR
jgi:uncharacterized protein YqfA (UPF0365 family)